LKKIADAYDIPYLVAADNNEINEKIENAMSIDGIVICDIKGSLSFDEIPKCISSRDENGKIVSAALENPYPFLPENELASVLKELSCE